MGYSFGMIFNVPCQI